MPIPDCDALAVHRALMEKYGIEMPVFKWRERAIARLSVQGYNSRAQMDLLLEALSELLNLETKAALTA